MRKVFAVLVLLFTLRLCLGTNLFEKLHSAKSGDTLLLEKNTTRENFSSTFSTKENPIQINKPISLFGNGIYSSNKTDKFSNLGFVEISEGAMNVCIRSCYIEEIIFNVNTIAKGIKFMGCFVKRIKFQDKKSNGKLSEVSFEGCYINGSIDFSNNAENISNSIFKNCFFVETAITNSGKNAKSLQFVNNQFLANCKLDKLESVVFTGNVFLHSEISIISMSVFNNNLTYECIGNKTIPFGNNSGNFNFCDANPLYKNINEIAKADFEKICTFNWKPSELSPLQNSGKDYKDIGITGGRINIFNEEGIFTGVYKFK